MSIKLIKPICYTQNMKKHLTKSRNKKISGVLAGIAEKYDWDPFWVRVVFAILVVATGVFPFVIAYILAAIIMDEASDVKVTDV